MFFFRNKEQRGCVDIYAPIKVNSETKKVIDLAESLLTPEQLKTFLIKNGNEEEVDDEVFGFRERMELYYGKMWPSFSLERTEQIIKEEIGYYKDLFEIGVKFDQNRIFIEKLYILFDEKKGEHARRIARVHKAMKKLSSSK